MCPTPERGSVSRSRVNFYAVTRMAEPLLFAKPLRVFAVFAFFAVK